jgi:hypothetical protein
MSTNTGGPAFPTSNGGSPDDGMTLRDYFAAKAMQGMLSNFDWMQHAAAQFSNIQGEELVPQMAYEIADAMLAARSRT